MTYTGQVQVDFVHDPTSAAFTWVDLSNRARAASYRRGRSYELDAVDAGTGSLTLRNDDGALDPTNGSSAYSPNVLPFRRVQHNVTVSGPGTVPVFTGLVERWPQEWEDTGYGYSPVQVVDMFTWFSNYEMPELYDTEILADSPTFYYPCSESVGAATVGDKTNHYVGAVVASSTHGGSITSGYNDSTPMFAYGTSSPTAMRVSSLAQGDGGYIEVPQAASNAALAAWPVTFEMVIKIDALPYSSTLVWNVQGGGNAFSYFLEVVSFELFLQFGDGTQQATCWVTTAIVGDGKWHKITWGMKADGKTPFLYVDGQGPSSVTPAPSAMAAITNLPMRFGGGRYPDSPGSWGSGYTGSFAKCAAYAGTDLPTSNPTRTTAHLNAFANGFAGETVDVRIARILSYAGWTATPSLDASPTLMTGARVNGLSALAALQDAAAADGGVFFISKSGVVTFRSRRTRMATTTNAVTFGENIAGGEIPYLTSSFDFDPTYIYNDVHVTRSGASTLIASDASSQSHYGKRTYDTTLDITSDAEALGAAQWILASNKDPHLRVRSVTVDALATPGAFAALLPLEIGSRVLVRRRPSGTTINCSSFVESIAWDMAPDHVTCTLELSPIPLQALLLNDATYGTINTTNVLGY